jgi:hypothetical protein
MGSSGLNLVLGGMIAAVFVAGSAIVQPAHAANPQDAQDAGSTDDGANLIAIIIYADSHINDPFADYTSIRDKGTTATSTAGIFTGPTARSQTTDAGGGTDAFYNASKIFSFGANQQLIVGAMYRYDSDRTNYSSSSPAAIGDGNTIRKNTNTFVGLVEYRFGDAYLKGGLGGVWGSGNWTNTIGGISGHFNSDGYVVSAAVGNVFTLFDSRATSHSTLPVKAPPKPSGGYALQLDLSGHLGYASNDTGGFTDNTGFIRGDERLHFWMLGAQARLFATIPNGRLTWVPYVTGTIDQQLGFTHTLQFPVQPAFAFPGDQVSFGDAQTFLGAGVGMAVQDASGFIVGVQGRYMESAQYQILGGQAYLRYQFPE